ncbi:isoprenylcysteine carboxylmethyltransferase family protein [Sulfurovum sp.]|uniref:methyltransferase family protein n=1 Tax=Sulfurovum sp. TaxID=1969726 RepID=UPI0025EFF2BA|nr:isoprenylcysteine carboxylmethyltransferase family protein [Sulfurovum sp.]
MKSKFEKSRILISRIIVVAILVFFIATGSYWEEDHGMMSYVLFCIGVIFVGIASLGRMWCSVYIAGYKDNKLITKGPYSLSRNPLYFFSMLGVIGIGFATETFTFPLLLTALFAIYYPFVIKSEEARLRTYFGNDFEDYVKKVPAFFPRFSSFDEPSQYMMNPAVYRNHIFSALWFIWIVGIFKVVEGLKELGFFGHLWIIY